MRYVWFSSIAVLALASCSTSLQPITEVQARDAAATLQTKISEHQEPVLESVTLYEAMARALKYNLDHRVSMMELNFARADYEMSHYEVLPDIVTRGGHYSRSNQLGSSSLSLISGRQSLEPSTATEKMHGTGALTATWNVLDLGLSKIRSEQLADETLIYEERRRKAIIQILSDVQTTYWRATSAQRLSQKLVTLEADFQTAFDDLGTLYMSRSTSPMLALTYQRELDDIQSEAQRLERNLSLAKVKLAGLMGLSPRQTFTLEAEKQAYIPQVLMMDYEAMIDLSLRQRPEMREAIYAKRLGEKEMRKVVLETLPSLEAFAGLNVSSNDFLFNSNWVDYGARASWNITKVFSLGSRKRKAKAKVSLEEQRGLAAAIAVMTQLGIARTLYEGSLAEYLAAQKTLQIQADILTQVEVLFAAGSASRQTVVKERMKNLITEARRDFAQAELKQALAHIYASMGFDPYGADIQGGEDVATIVASLQAHWEGRQNLPEI